MNARLPLWSQSTFMRPRSQIIVRNCLQFFELRSLLIQDIMINKDEVSNPVNKKKLSFEFKKLIPKLFQVTIFKNLSICLYMVIFFIGLQ